MLDWLWTVPALPFAGFAVLALGGGRLGPRPIAWIGAGSVGLSALLSALVAYALLTGPNEAHVQELWTWMAVDGLAATVGLHLDRLSLVMMLVVTWVGLVIQVYASGYMAGEEGFRRFFAYMDLFVGFMLVLVLAGDLLLLFLGWEGVGLCSWLLIGHWYRDADNGRAAQKAFIVTRIGDAFLVAGVLVLVTGLGSTDIGTLLQRAAGQWPAESALATLAAALLLGGAAGKSAQLPLQVWLPDAMAGPTPVSALIHAATMVTAGAYLIARMLPLFELAPGVLDLVGVLGAATVILGAAAALGQRDLKRILAYSTLSQLGYLFLALGLGAVSAAFFHLVTHAFFKALLFLAAGAVIASLGGEHDVLRMGGLRRVRPLAFWGFLTGAASLAAVPLVTAGFYSKALVLDTAWAAGGGARLLWGAGVLGAFLTSVYVFRALFLVFLGERRTEPSVVYGSAMSVPMVVLALLSVGGGILPVPALLAGFDLHGTRPPGGHLLPELAAVAVSLVGIWIAYRLAGDGWRHPGGWKVPEGVARSVRAGFGFDRLYEGLVVRPFLALAWLLRRDPPERLFQGLAAAVRVGHRLLSLSQTGVLRWYATATALGAVLLVGTLALLAGVAP